MPTISIHALREEGDESIAASLSAAVSISIHALREEGDLHKVAVHSLVDISIHALREEGDCIFRVTDWTGKRFLSTPSARRATHRALFLRLWLLISIHALREEGDRKHQL